MNHETYSKLPPHDADLERAVLGAIINESGVLETVAELLNTPAHFYHPIHATIYDNLCQLQQKGYPTDAISLTEQLRKTGKLDETGGPYYLQQLSASSANSAHILHHALLLKEKYLKREQIRVAGELLQKAYGPDDVFDTFEQAEQQLFNLSGVTGSRQLQPLAKVADQVMKTIIDVRGSENDLTGVPSGFHQIDLKTNGWQPTDLIIIAARPGVGKTAFSLNLALNSATDILKPVPVALFNLEMQDTQVVKRGLSAYSKIPLEHINRPKSLGESEMQLLTETRRRFKNIPLYIEDTPALTTAQLRSKMRRYIKKHHIGLVIIDYLQLMGCAKKTNNRENEVSQVSRDLKMIAKELQVPIIALSQLNRDIEKRTSKEPTLADLRESGAIEQDADMILFLFRPSDEAIQENVDMADKIMAGCKKHRNGDLFQAMLRFDKRVQVFSDAGWQG